MHGVSGNYLPGRTCGRQGILLGGKNQMEEDMIFLILMLAIIAANLVISILLFSAFKRKQRQEIIEDEEVEALKEEMRQMKNMMLYGLGGDEED